MTAQQHFLILANPRCRTTLLQTSLARLSDCVSDYELFWDGENPKATDKPPFSFVVRNDWSWRKFFEGFSKTATITGTRVIVHGTAYYTPEEACGFISSIPRDIAIIHIVRDYFEILKSSRIRDHITWISEDALETALDDNPEGRDSLMWQGLREDALRSIDGRRNPGNPSVEDSQQILFRFFINDLVITEIARRADRKMVVAFEDVTHRFHEIAGFVGSRCSREVCDHIIETPVALRLPPIPDEELREWKHLRQVCDILNAGLQSFIARDIPLDQVWTGGQIHVPRENSD